MTYLCRHCQLDSSIKTSCLAERERERERKKLISHEIWKKILLNIQFTYISMVHYCRPSNPNIRFTMAFSLKAIQAYDLHFIQRDKMLLLTLLLSFLFSIEMAFVTARECKHTCFCPFKHTLCHIYVFFVSFFFSLSFFFIWSVWQSELILIDVMLRIKNRMLDVRC